MALQHPEFTAAAEQGWNCWPKRWPCSQEQTLLKAEERGKVRGQAGSIFLSTPLCAAWLLPLPPVPP